MTEERSVGKWERKPHRDHDTNALDSSGAPVNLRVPGSPLHIHSSEQLTSGGKPYNHKVERLKLLKALREVYVGSGVPTLCS